MVDTLFLDDCTKIFRSLTITTAQQIGRELTKVLAEGKLRTTQNIKEQPRELLCTIIVYHWKKWTFREKAILTLSISIPYIHQKKDIITPTGIKKGVQFGLAQIEEGYFTEEVHMLLKSVDYKSDIRGALITALKQQLRIPGYNKPIRRGQITA
tara:strand:- start:230 stop:691 length:462 start_codon:yes stop_codon:yes gene_type:complete